MAEQGCHENVMDLEPQMTQIARMQKFWIKIALPGV
jgi:hypothetical protein